MSTTPIAKTLAAVLAAGTLTVGLAGVAGATTGPRSPEPTGASAPGPLGPRTSEPRTSEPRTTAPTTSQPRTSVPRTTVARTSGLDASRTPDLTEAKTRCGAEIDRRTAELDRLDAEVAKAPGLTAAHRAALVANLTSARQALTALAAKIAADTDPATLKTDCEAIAESLRIFALRSPQTHLVVVGDGITSGITKFDSVVATLTDAVAKAKAEGNPQADAAAAVLEDLKAKVADAAAKGGSIADTVIGYTPADYNANHDLLVPARTAAKTAREDLRAAGGDAHKIAKLLRPEAPAPTTPAPTTTAPAATTIS